MGTGSLVIHTEHLISLSAFLFWVRFIVMIEMTPTFGPFIRLSLRMLSKLFTYCLIFLVVIFAFSAVGQQLFPQIDQYGNLQIGITTLMGSVVGNFRLQIFDSQDGSLEIGKVF